MTSEPEPVVTLHAQVGEGPVWDHRAGVLVWVDVLGGLLHRTEPDTGTTVSVPLGTHVGAVALLGEAGYLVATRDSLREMHGDVLGSPLTLFTAEDVRTNDGASDPVGRFLIGTMAYDAAPRRGALYVRETDASVRTVLSEVTVSNGLGWSPAGDRMYYVDSASQGVDVFDYAIDTGAVTDRRRLTSIDADDGIPDGLTVDSAGAVWVALWGGGAVRRYSPDGDLLATVQVPVPLSSSCCFGGPSLDTLFITTASHGRADSDPRGTLDGAVFAVQTDVVGLAEPVIPLRTS